MAHRLKRPVAAGTLLGLFGDAGDAPARLEHPTDVAVAEDGTIYVVVVGHDRMTVFLEQNRNKIGAGSLLKRTVIHDEGTSELVRRVSVGALGLNCASAALVRLCG
jgi:hypothetical protein